MISDKLEKLEEYAATVPAFTVIAKFLKENKLEELPLGRIDLEDGIFVNMQEYEPYPAGDMWETHEKYGDLQVVVEGNEKMDWASRLDCVGGQGYNDEYDYEFYKTCEGSYASIYGEAGVFAWFNTNDAHRPGLKYKAEKVKKAVFKVPVK